MTTQHTADPHLYFEESTGRWYQHNPQTGQLNYVEHRSGHERTAQQTFENSTRDVEPDYSVTNANAERRFSNASSDTRSGGVHTLEQRMASASLTDYTTSAAHSRLGQTVDGDDPALSYLQYAQPYTTTTSSVPEQSFAAGAEHVPGGHKKTSKPKSTSNPQWGEDVVESDPAIPDLHYAPPDAITQPDILQKGFTAQVKVAACGPRENNKQRLDQRYVVQKQPKKFFVPGKVIKIFWPELAGNVTDAKTRVTAADVKFKDVNMIGKIRWFVVVSTGHNACTCLPISTYGGRGVSKPDLLKWQHCIVYTEAQSPPLSYGEAPLEHEQPMRTAIRVKPTVKGDKMDRMSRLNYGKMYTIEHNVRVYDFGMLRREYIEMFTEQWDQILNYTKSQARMANSPAGYQMSTTGQHDTELFAVDKTPPAVLVPDPRDPSYVDYGWATENYSPQIEENRQIAIQKGDHLGIIEWPWEDWARVFNKRSLETGLVAAQFIELFDSAVALHDWIPPDPRSSIQMQKDDKLRLIDNSQEGWATVCNLRTAESGLVPKNYIASTSKRKS